MCIVATAGIIACPLLFSKQCIPVMFDAVLTITLQECHVMLQYTRIFSKFDNKRQRWHIRQLKPPAFRAGFF